LEKNGAAEPALGAKPVDLVLPEENRNWTKGIVNEGVRRLFKSKQLCDVALVINGQRFLAHKAVLAATSTNFRTYLCTPNEADENIKNALVCGKAPSAAVAPAVDPKTTTASSEFAVDMTKEAPVEADGRARGITNNVDAAHDADLAANPEGALQLREAETLELQVQGVETSEAMNILLEYVYFVGTGESWEYSPSNVKVNKDVLRLAQIFALPHLHEYAARWITKGLTSSNVVERLVVCEENGLDLLRQKIMAALTANPSELAAISSCPEITQHPRILQDLLMQMTSLYAAPAVGKKEKQVEKLAEKPAEKEKPTKRARKGA